MIHLGKKFLWGIAVYTWLGELETSRAYLKLLRIHWRNIFRISYLFIKTKYTSWKNVRDLRRELEKVKKGEVPK